MNFLYAVPPHIYQQFAVEQYKEEVLCQAPPDPRSRATLQEVLESRGLVKEEQNLTGGQEEQTLIDTSAGGQHQNRQDEQTLIDTIGSGGQLEEEQLQQEDTEKSGLTKYNIYIYPGRCVVNQFSWRGESGRR